MIGPDSSEREQKPKDHIMTSPASASQLSVWLAPRPWWMNGMLAFCAFMTFIYMPFDLFWKPVEGDMEIWFGIALHGWAAKATEPVHWAIYAAGTLGFWKMRPWMHPWAALYIAQIAIGMFVWSILDERGSLLSGIVSGAVFAALAAVTWREGHRFAE